VQWVLLLALPLVFVVSDVPAHGQKYLAGLTGDVSDTTGAKIVGATVTATDTTTRFVTKAVTNDSGRYNIPFLTPDTYAVTAEGAGFQTETKVGIILTAGTNFGADFVLKVGSQSQNVTVTAASPLIETVSASIGTTFTEQQVHDLPSMGRVPGMVASLAAGAYDSAYIGGKTDSTLVPWGGGPTATSGNGVGGYTRPMIDGVPDDALERNGTSQGGPYTAFTPSPESIQEVKIQTALYDAEYGHGSGTVINQVLRSGTNTFHGAAYFVFRNTYLDANVYERVPNQNGALNPAGPTRRLNGTWNQPGFVFDGPVRIPHLYNGRDKTYFMVAYEHISLRGTTGNSGGAGATNFVPTAAMAGGDFSALCPGGFNSGGVCVAGGGVQIYDPLTLDASNNRTPFANDKIPSSRFNPTGVALLKLYPAPNTNQSATVNYISNKFAIPEGYYSLITRIDHSINDNNKWSAVFDNQQLGQHIPNLGYPTSIGPAGQVVLRNNHGGSVDYVSILPHGYVLDARIGVNYHPFAIFNNGSSYDLSTLGISATGITYQTFPGTTFSDSYTGLQPGSGSQSSDDTYITTAAIVSKSIGKHNVRFGFEGELHRYNALNPFSGLGTFNYNRQFTQKNSVNTAVGADASSGNPIASLLLGYPSGTTGTTGGYTINPAFAISQPYQAYFVQDDWRAARKLTFNLGLRWEYESPYTERHNRLATGFCTTCTNPLQASVSGLTLNGGLQFASSSNRQYYQPQHNEFQPRFGVSYQLNPRIVLHGGAGLIYINSIEAANGPGFSAATGYTATTDNSHPFTSLANPFPGGVTPPTGSSLGLSTQIGQALNFIAPGHTSPGILQWTASAQTQLPANMVLQVAYAGNKTWNWGINNNINPLPAKYYNQGTAGITYLNTKVSNPMAGQIPANGNLNGATILNSLINLPYPEFGTITELDIPAGEALYNAAQVTLNKRMGHNLSVLGTFTWQKMLTSFQYLNPTDPAPEHYEDGNPTLMGNLAVIYELPRFSSSPAYVREVLGGWQFNSILRAYNGGLFATPGGAAIQLSDPAKNISSGSVVPGLGNARGNYFNTCYKNAAGVNQVTGRDIGANVPGCGSDASVAAFQLTPSFTLNTLRPRMESVRTRVHPLADASLFKKFPIHESATFEIRGEFFNVLNTPNFGGPGTTPGSTNYGVVGLNEANDARIGQLTARINF
jgi:hypothetical protein